MDTVYFRQDKKNKKSIKAVKPPYKNFAPLEYPDQIWNTREDGTLDIGHVMDEPGIADQQFKDECDINNILASYQETGTINHKNPSPGIYGDFHDVRDFQESMDLVIYAKEAFDALPANIRNKFENNPAKLVEFCNDANNLEEAIKLGLAEPKVRPIANDDKTTNASGPTNPTAQPNKTAPSKKQTPQVPPEE